MDFEELSHQVFNIQNAKDFQQTALDVFRYQYFHNDVYRRWVNLLSVNPDCVNRVEDIPALPIECFKTHTVVSFQDPPVGYFQSSGTTSMQHSHHYFRSLGLYDTSLLRGFTRFWGDPSQYCIIALLPNYLQQGHSSLVHMMELLMQKTQCAYSRFYDKVTPELLSLLHNHHGISKKLMLFGVTYALLDILEHGDVDLSDCIVFETGGMKGHREEMVKGQLHKVLCRGFHVDVIASEYGMCELFSQAYSQGKGLFLTPLWMQIRIRDTHAPLHIIGEQRSGGIDVIDLANLDSCSFIATQDLGKSYGTRGFEILGRIENSDIRGCNLMTEM